MATGGPTGVRVFRAGTRVYVLLGFLVGWFVALGVVVGIHHGLWDFLAVVAPVGLVLLLLPTVLRLEVRPDGFSYRNLSGNCAVAFADVERAYIWVLHTGNAPPVAAFSVKPRGSRAVQVNLRTFPIRAAAVLFSALARYGIEVEVPDQWAARRMANQIRAELGRAQALQDAEPGAAPDPAGT